MDIFIGLILGLVLTFFLADVLGFPVGSILDKLAELFGLRREESTFEENNKNKVAIVTEKISGLNKGRVKLEGVTWNAYAEDESSIFNEGEQVIVSNLDGNNLIVIEKN